MLMILCLLLPAASGIAASSHPEVLIEATEPLAPLATRLNNLTPHSIPLLLNQIGGNTIGPPIRVILAPEESEWAQQVPPWISGYAIPRSHLIVLLPDRVPSYPYESIESVFLHELAHIFIARAASFHPIPRWFDEGLAMIATHEWAMEDQARLLWTRASLQSLSLDTLNHMFLDDEVSTRQAYSIAYAFLSDAIQHSNQDFPKTLLQHVERGIPFQQAFAQLIRMTPNHALTTFWKQQNLLTEWVPFLTSSSMLWAAMIAILLYVFYRQRKRTTAIRERWKEEDYD